MNKPPYTIIDQIALLKRRGMFFADETEANLTLGNVGYYRLKGYWWDLQIDNIRHTFKPDTNFEAVVERYNFDRQLKVLLFDAITRIEIAVRAKLIYHLSVSYGGLWYLNTTLFETASYTKDGITKTTHLHTLDELQKEYNRSQEIFVRDQNNRYPGQSPDAWKILETASLGTISKLYKSLKNQLSEKALIANELGLSMFTELSSWLEAITLVRNIIAHHSRLWSRNIPKRPILQLNNPTSAWLNPQLQQAQINKPFAVIACMVYLCNHLNKSDDIKQKIIGLIDLYPDLQLGKYGFPNNWRTELLWMRSTPNGNLLATK